MFYIVCIWIHTFVSFYYFEYLHCLLHNVLKWLKCHWYSNCFRSRIVLIFLCAFRLVGYGFFFIVLIPRARFRCTAPGCQLFTSGRVQHKGRNQVTVNNTPNAQPSTKLFKVFFASHYKKAIVYYRHYWCGRRWIIRKTAARQWLRPTRLSDNHR